MSSTAHRAHQDVRRCTRAAHVALCWVGVFTGFHIYWYLGGSFGSPGELPGEPRSLAGWAFTVLVDGAFALGLLVCLAIARDWALGRLTRPVGTVVWLGCILLLLRGGTGAFDDLARVTGMFPNGITGLSTTDTIGATSGYARWSGHAIEAYFLTGGMIFTWLAIRYRQHPQRGVMCFSRALR